MIVATPVTEDSQSASAWGKAHWIGVAGVIDGEVRSWQVHEVAWDESHDEGAHGSHHARIVRFVREQGITAVVVDHMGPGMVQVMLTMRIPLLPATPGDAKASILAALAANPTWAWLPGRPARPETMSGSSIGRATTCSFCAPTMRSRVTPLRTHR